MIKRYTRKIMGDLWTDENKYRAWLDVEVAACEAMAEIGRIPNDSVNHHWNFKLQQK